MYFFHIRLRSHVDKTVYANDIGCYSARLTSGASEQRASPEGTFKRNQHGKHDKIFILSEYQLQLYIPSLCLI